MSLALAIGTIIGSAFVPVIYLELLDVFQGSWAIALYIVVAGLVTLVSAALLARLNRRTDARELPIPVAEEVAR
jgi:VIT1/CCC1 family predicted Fe2+/Mn2+ transporter